MQGLLDHAQQQQHKRSRVVVRQPSKQAKPRKSVRLGTRFFFSAAAKDQGQPHACSTQHLLPVLDKTILLALCALKNSARTETQRRQSRLPPRQADHLLRLVLRGKHPVITRDEPGSFFRGGSLREASADSERNWGKKWGGNVAAAGRSFFCCACCACCACVVYAAFVGRPASKPTT